MLPSVYRQETILLTIPRWYFFCGSFFSVLYLLCLCARLFICALWSPAEKGLTSWLSFVVSDCEFVAFPFGILGQVWYLIVGLQRFIEIVSYRDTFSDDTRIVS